MSQNLTAALITALPQLPARDQAFAQSLLASAQSRRGVSDKQLHWMQVLVDRVNNPQPAPAPAATVNVSGIITLLSAAASRLKYPKVRLVTESGQRVVLGIAGERSKYAGDVMVTDGGPFGANVYFGRITQSGDVIASKSLTDEVLALLVAFAADPAGVGALIGKRYGHCCFCARELETRESLAVGYGPVCAEKYQLPWGDVAPEAPVAAPAAPASTCPPACDGEACDGEVHGGRTPVYVHDCEKCTFLGHAQGHDLYVCGGDVIARYGSEGPDYKCTPWECRPTAPVYAAAAAMAAELGLSLG